MTDNYHNIAQLIANNCNPNDLVLIDCDCSLFDEYRDGTKPEHYKTSKEAALAWTTHAIFERRYYGVHFNGKHVLRVRNKYQLSQFGLKGVDCR